MSKNDEMQCLMSMPNLGTMVGKWIAIIENEVVASGESGAAVYKKSRKEHPDKIPFVMKVPDDRVMLL